MIDKVHRGQTTRRYAYYKNNAGILIDPVSPKITIVDPINVVLVNNFTPNRESIGVYYYDYYVTNDAKYGIYTEKWSGILEGIVAESEGYFEVYPVGAEEIDPGLREELRLRICDQDSNNYIFSDAELNKILESARLKHNVAYKNWGDVPANEATLILMLAHADVCLILATNSAKYYAVKGNINIDKGERTDYYLEIRRSLRAEYYKECRKLGLLTEDDVNVDTMSEITVGHIAIMDRDTGKMVSYNFDNVPPLIKLNYALSNNNVVLSWEKPLMPDFLKYELLKDNKIILSIWDVNRLTYVDTNVSIAKTYKYSVNVVDTNNLKTSSNEVEVLVR